MNPAPIRNALTIDVEDYFHVSAFASHIARADWDRMPCRVERNVDAILELLEEQKAHATYFMLGWVAERYPGLVRRIVDQEHVLACHGYAHQRATEQSREEFRQLNVAAEAKAERERQEFREFSEGFSRGAR